MENRTIEVKGSRLRERVREMEAFGWVLGETYNMPGGKVKLDLWRKPDLPNINKLIKLEYDLSRLPRESVAFTLKWATSVFIGLAALIVLTTVYIEFLCVIVFLPWPLFWFFELFIVPEYRTLSQRRERIVHRAWMIMEGGESEVEPSLKLKVPPSGGRGYD